MKSSPAASAPQLLGCRFESYPGSQVLNPPRIITEVAHSVYSYLKSGILYRGGPSGVYFRIKPGGGQE
jgi:hypothetical protein